jgi:hypothetical protein
MYYACTTLLNSLDFSIVELHIECCDCYICLCIIILVFKDSGLFNVLYKFISLNIQADASYYLASPPSYVKKCELILACYQLYKILTRLQKVGSWVKKYNVTVVEYK